MFDLKAINSVLEEMETERGISRERIIEAIEQSLATAYKKEYGQRGQVIKAHFDLATGNVVFEQIKIAVSPEMIREVSEEDEDETGENTTETEEISEDTDQKVRFDEEKHIMIDTARMIKRDVEPGEELAFSLESKSDFGRIAAQTAKQVIMQKFREAEKDAAMADFGQKAGQIVVGQVQRFERGFLYVDLGRVTAMMPYEEQIPGERYKPGDRIRALLLAVEESSRGVFLKLSRAHPDFLVELFAQETPELQNGTVEVKAVAREAGARSKIAVFSHDEYVDPVGSLVGQHGVRVSTVMSELGGEKIDIIEWSPVNEEFVEDALLPARVLQVNILSEPNEESNERGHAEAVVQTDQQSLAIGRGGQNVRLAAKLTGWKIDIVSSTPEAGEEAPEEVTTDIIDSVPANDPGDERTEDRGLNPDRDEEDPVDTPEEAEAAIDAVEAAEGEPEVTEANKTDETV